MKNKTIRGIVYIIILMCVLLFILAKIKNAYGTISYAAPVNATPITNKVIILDAGHGKPDEGAVGFTGTTEQAINLQIVLKLQKIIEQSGAKVILTRSDENGVFSVDSTSIKSKKISDIKNRESIVNESNADVFVSIHLNKYSDSQYSGWQTFYKSGNDESKQLAEKIQIGLNENINKKNNRIPMAIKGVYLMDHINVPGVVVECGFISNPEEEQKLKQEEYQAKIVWGIYSGIQEHFYEK